LPEQTALPSAVHSWEEICTCAFNGAIYQGQYQWSEALLHQCCGGRPRPLKANSLAKSKDVQKIERTRMHTRV
jgi:hypothetical protein